MHCRIFADSVEERFPHGFVRLCGGSSVFRWVGGRWLFGFNTIAPWGRLCENPSPYALRSGTWGVRATVLGVSGCETAPPKLVVWTRPGSWR